MDTFIEKVVDFGVKKFKSISDFDENLETLERYVKQLLDKALDVKTEVDNREQSGRRKRKREVESWFHEVTKIEEELRALKEVVTRGKKNGGVLEKMNGRVGELLEQSKHFGTLVHDMYEPEECPLLASQFNDKISKQNLEVIWTWLQDENVSSIGIYGMGGVGKTTLGIQYRLGDFRLRVGKVSPVNSENLRGIMMEMEYLPISSWETSHQIMNEFFDILKETLGGRSLPGHFVHVEPNFSEYGLSDQYTSQHTAVQYASFMAQMISIGQSSRSARN